MGGDGEWTKEEMWAVTGEPTGSDQLSLARYSDYTVPASLVPVLVAFYLHGTPCLYIVTALHDLVFLLTPTTSNGEFIVF